VSVAGFDDVRETHLVRRAICHVQQLLGRRAFHRVREALAVGEGKTRPLSVVLDQTAALPAAADLTAMGIARLSALFDVLDVAVLPEHDWRALDPEAHTPRDIDHPADLA
jgi:hypothetical protein